VAPPGVFCAATFADRARVFRSSAAAKRLSVQRFRSQLTVPPGKPPPVDLRALIARQPRARRSRAEKQPREINYYVIAAFGRLAGVETTRSDIALSARPVPCIFLARASRVAALQRVDPRSLHQSLSNSLAEIKLQAGRIIELGAALRSSSIVIDFSINPTELP